MELSTQLDRVLITSITPYFLEKGWLWFEQNKEKLQKAAATQPFFKEHLLALEQNQQYSLTQLLRRLDELGYEKVFQVRDPGEFAQRGGIVEIFPITQNFAVRIDFVGNTIDRIEQLDIAVENEELSKKILKKRLSSQKLFSDLKGLKEGEYLVHLDHGIGRYAGITEIKGQSYYILEYAAGDRLFVPLGLERKLSRYVGFVDPAIARLGSLLWQKTKKRIREEVEKLAKQLLDLYAQRELARREPLLARGEWEEKIREGFPFQETPDQIQALQDIAKDLAKEKPMDRLVCGDVGFGKTEIALRTAVTFAEQGKQVVLLAPTTILGHQHYLLFKNRLKNTPITVALLSRLQSKKEQVEIIAKLKKGTLDIVIGTHRLLSSDVQFFNLGLLVIDDEQKFGVKQKEKLKELRSSLDVLSLSATPIPRTLYMALSSLKKVSIMRTPPEGRLPIHTIVARRQEKIVKEAIEKELKRKGQVYYLHNRVGTIQRVRQYLQKLVPKAKIGVAHAKLSEKELLRVMEDFKERKYDVLVATTIIESGLDLPNVNTLIVEEAAKLGLTQAYQIRGRIGRSAIQSFAYFLYGPAKLPDKAKLRLKALQETTELGSGYKIALQDMEIRGAGNILGKEQSGAINTVGLNLYCQMLAEAVEKARK